MKYYFNHSNQAAANSQARLATGRGQATVEELIPVEEVTAAASTIFPESIHRIGSPVEVIEYFNQWIRPCVMCSHAWLETRNLR